MSRAALIPVLAFALCPALAAQQPAPSAPVLREPTPEIITTGTGEARMTPDRATVSIGVHTQAATAAKASAENARKQQAVIDTLRAMGIPANQITTVNYSVYPEQSYHPDQGDKEPKIVGYNVNNTVQVEVQKIDRVGALIDAALAKGANGINSLEFSASNTDSARRAALADALASARGDAEALAQAAGGTLGMMIEASTSFVVPPRPLMGMAARMVAGGEATPTPINPGEQTIHVNVTTRWRFAPGGR